MKKIFQKPYVYWVFLIFFVYVVLNTLLSGFYVTIRFIPHYINTLNWLNLILSVVFSLVIAFMVSVTSVFAYLKFKERKEIKEGVIACAGAIGGFATGVCSACISGILPFVFSLFGISFSLALLPLGGMEVQALLIILLGLNLYWLNKK